jgi:hypothetical protein
MSKFTITKLVDAYAEASSAAKRAAEAADELKAKILALGDGQFLGTDHKVTVSTSIPVLFDSVLFRETHPALYEQFKTQGSPRQSVRIYGR